MKEDQPQSTSSAWRDRLVALRNVPPVLGILWQSGRAVVTWGLILRVLVAALPVAIAKIAAYILNDVQRVFNHQGLPVHFWWLVGLETVLNVFAGLLMRGIDYSDSLLADRYTHFVSMRVMEQAAQLDLTTYEDPVFYDRLERARVQATDRLAMIQQMGRLLQQGITTLIWTGALLWYSPWLLLLLALGVLPTFLGETHFAFLGYAKNFRQTPAKRQMDYLRQTAGSREGAKELKLFNLSGFFTGRFNLLSKQIYDENVALSRKKLVAGGLLGIIATLGYYGAYVFVIWRALNRAYANIGDYYFLTNAIIQASSNLQQVFSTASGIADQALFLTDLLAFFEMKPTVQSKKDGLRIPRPIRQGFEFRNVSFAYPGTTRRVLKDFNFILRPGERIALIGENGQGKTTVVKLITRLYDPTEGQILLDGVDLREYDLDDLHHEMGVIFQDFMRYEMTARDNIGVGRVEREPTESEIEHAAEQSLAASVVAKLSGGYDQMLGRRFEGGVELSGGEWQRVALARAYLRDAQLLILDEPTAALDARSELEVFERFAELTEGKMALLISHRFSTVRMADRIVVLEGGRLVEEGTHSALMALGGRYAGMFGNAGSELSMTEKANHLQTDSDAKLPEAESAATPVPVEETAEAELAVVAKVPAPEIERTEEQLRRDAATASHEWHVARHPRSGDTFSRRIAAAQSAYQQVFRELDSRPMPTYKPGEPLDPLLELRENPRLLQAALDEIHSIRRKLTKLPVVERPRDGDEPRIVTVADTYLKATESRWDGDWVLWFLDEVQKADPLTLRELWAFPTAVKFLLVEELLTQAKSQIDNPAAFDREAAGLLAARFDSIRNTIYANWAQMIEGLVVFNKVLRQDPAGAYPQMDFDSRENYRERVSNIARHSDHTELEVAQAALRLAQQPAPPNAVPRRALRHAHVGFYLVDTGFPELARGIGYRPPFIDRVRMAVWRSADDFYILGIMALALLLIAVILFPLASNYSIFGGMTVAFIFLLIPAGQGAVDLVNNTVTALFKATALAKLDYSKGLPQEFTTLVAVPTLLLNENQVRELIEELEVRYLANQDPNMHFAILSDLPDSVSRPRPNDTDPLVELAVGMINKLNKRYAGKGGGFYLLHRHRIFNTRQGVWMGWERKRGKLLDLNKFIRGDFDSFPVKIGNLDVLRTVRYVITLDSDTQLPRGTAHAMVGAMTHPLNRAVIDPESRIVTEGYGILQPRVGVSVHSASQSRLAAIYSGQTGFDIYTRAVSDAYQDLYGEGIFTGKGIYEVETLHAVLDRRFPRNSLLSHDLIEGAYARAGLATDIEVIDDYPSHYSAYRRRQHRWVRGDWQIAQWLFGKVPDESGRMVKNPISAISRWKIFDNLRRSLVETMTLILLVAGWLGLPGGPLYWTLVTVFLLFAPSLVSLVFSVGRAWASPQKGEVQEAFVGFGQNLIITLLNLAFLPHQMLMALDAIIRSLVRRFVTGQRLLEWETAAQAESTGGKTTPVDRYLQATPLFAIGIAVLVALVQPTSLIVAAPLLVLWLFESAITAWLNKPPRDDREDLTDKQEAFLREMGLRTWRFFYEYGGPAHNYLVPDNVEEHELFEAARVSPTNFGLLLNARQAAQTFGWLSIPEFAALSHRSLDTFDRMEKRNGHIYNWYDTRTLAPIAPRVVSSVDSGNLAASFYTLRSGAEALLLEPLLHPRLWAGIRDQLALLESIGATPASLPPVPTTDALRPWMDWCFAAQLSPAFETVRDMELTDKTRSEGDWWLAELLRRIDTVCAMAREYAPWLDKEFLPLESVLKDTAPVAIGRGVAVIDDLDGRLQRAWSTKVVDQAETYLIEKLRAALATAREKHAALVTSLTSLTERAEGCVANMDFAFLIEPSRQILSIGYMVEQEELHKACYDLLCSEARIGAFVAVARGDASQQSWFKLGRIHTVAYGRPALIAWTGTMFEYLMPALWMRSYPDTLVTRTLTNVVAIQRAYAREHGNIPWGISECGYAEMDDQGHYHYLAFGMPSIALKWDAVAGPVISPYSTFLALMIDEGEALKNLKRMAGMGWVGAYGFYEAGDYQKSLKQPELVKEWMAHHQGMSLLAVLNLLHGNIVQEWFHANANLKATELLLHEKPIRESLLLAEYKESGRKKSAA